MIDTHSIIWYTILYNEVKETIMLSVLMTVLTFIIAPPANNIVEINNDTILRSRIVYVVEKDNTLEVTLDSSRVLIYTFETKNETDTVYKKVKKVLRGGV